MLIISTAKVASLTNRTARLLLELGLDASLRILRSYITQTAVPSHLHLHLRIVRPRLQIPLSHPEAHNVNQVGRVAGQLA
jgi:hypothetical protein